jgi:hypothetical protein
MPVTVSPYCHCDCDACMSCMHKWGLCCVSMHHTNCGRWYYHDSCLMEAGNAAHASRSCSFIDMFDKSTVA